jgi:hypothetical protein
MPRHRIELWTRGLSVLQPKQKSINGVPHPIQHRAKLRYCWISELLSRLPYPTIMWAEAGAGVHAKGRTVQGKPINAILHSIVHRIPWTVYRLWGYPGSL